MLPKQVRGVAPKVRSQKKKVKKVLENKNFYDFFALAVKNSSKTC
jgi:hypothetical protein